MDKENEPTIKELEVGKQLKHKCDSAQTDEEWDDAWHRLCEFEEICDGDFE